MKRFVCITIMMLMWMAEGYATDIVYLGSYRNFTDSREYSLILEYEDTVPTALEIYTCPGPASGHTSIVINGKKDIAAFHKCLVKVMERFRNYDKKNDKKERQKIVSLKWPTVFMSGELGGEEINYDRYDIVGKCMLKALFTYLEGKKYLMVIGEESDNGITSNHVHCIETDADSPIEYLVIKHHYLRSYCSFCSVKDFEDFCKLTDPEYMKERIRMKERMKKDG